MWESRPDVMYEKIAADTMMEKESWRQGKSQRKPLLQLFEEFLD